MDREKLRREAVRQLRRMASGAPVEELRITQREDGSPELELAGIDPYQLSGVKLGKNGVELSFYSRLEAIDRLLELAGPFRCPGALVRKTAAGTGLVAYPRTAPEV